MKKVNLFFLFMTLLSFTVTADEYSGCAADDIVNGASRIWMNESNNTIKFVELNEPLSLNPHLMENWLKEILNTNENTGFVLYQTIDDKLGNTHFRFKQTYKGYVVTNGVYYVHTRNGQVVSANGEFYPDIEVNTNSVITTGGAIAIGKEQIHGHKWAWKDGAFPTPELQVVYANEAYHFAYKTDIYSYEPIAREWVFVDAMSGKVVTTHNRIHSNAVEGEAHCKYHGVQTIIVDSVGPNEYRLRDETRGGGVETYDLNEGFDYDTAEDFTDEDNIWDTTTDFDDAALDAHWGTEMMYDYMLNVHNWESYDNNGTVMLSYVHYGESFYNAFWDGSRMTYGDGDGYDAGPLTSTEVVGHEIMHGVTEYTAGLIYSDESGAINESFSDCFGVILDYEINPLTANFLMGDAFTTSGDAFRNMADPNEYFNPDTYEGDYWNYGGVHNQSGVQNFWLYLVTQGGVGTNDNGDDYSVDAIPMADAGDILFRSLSVYLTPSSPYSDARFYGVLSAKDLYGECSEQEISVTNGWHAVGLGDPFNTDVIADLNASSNENCQLPSIVQFTNASLNGSSFSWDFGNGETSTDENPIVAYGVEGSYTVTLITTGVGLCAGVDTIVLTDYITVNNTGGPTVPSCSPISISPLAWQGIFDFEFVDINNSSEGSTENYKDYTCTFSTDVQEGILYPFEVETGEEEMIKIWADVDADGVFDNNSELVYSSTVPAANHIGQLIIPDTDLYGQPLRLRVKSDLADYDISDPCNTVVNGQVEDYTIIVSANNQAPDADFVASGTLVQLSSTVTFTDLTQNLPDTWYWEFPGGTPSTSTEQHPQVTYDAIGVYAVSLIVNNMYGEATEVKVDYITVTSIATMCTNDESSAPFGLFYDSGGTGGEYVDQENCSFLISPDCAADLTLEFTFFSLEDYYDNLYIYDGVDQSAPLVGEYTGNISPGTVVSTSGSFYIVFDSDFSVTFPGWEANWISTQATVPPVADFSISNNNIPLGTSVSFTDLTTESPSVWSWDFGDGGNSTEQHPTHIYTTPGTYTVELTVENCFSSDVITYTVTVQEAPAIAVDPTTLALTLDCGEVVTEQITVTNNGGGDLVVSFDGDILVPTGSFVIAPGTSEVFNIVIEASMFGTGTFVTSFSINSNDPGFSEIVVPIGLDILELDAAINYTGNPAANAPISFEAVSSDATFWFWDFGDGNTSTEQNPIHTFQTEGPFIVTLTVTSMTGCVTAINTTLDITTGIDELESEISIYPNPTSGDLVVRNIGSEQYYEIEIINTIGQVLKRIDTSESAEDIYHLSLDDYPAGVYTIGLNFKDNLSLHKKIVLHKEK